MQKTPDAMVAGTLHNLKNTMNHMIHQAHVLEYVHIHVDAVIVLLLWGLLVDTFANMAVKVNVFMLMISKVFETNHDMGVFMIMMVKVCAYVSIYLMRRHVYLDIRCTLPLHTSTSK